jgi:hypothetical protein
VVLYLMARMPMVDRRAVRRSISRRSCELLHRTVHERSCINPNSN